MREAVFEVKSRYRQERVGHVGTAPMVEEMMTVRFHLPDPGEITSIRLDSPILTAHPAMLHFLELGHDDSGPYMRLRSPWGDYMVTRTVFRVSELWSSVEFPAWLGQKRDPELWKFSWRCPGAQDIFKELQERFKEIEEFLLANDSPVTKDAWLKMVGVGKMIEKYLANRASDEHTDRQEPVE